MLLGEPLDGAGKRLSGNVGTAPARSVTWPGLGPPRRFPDCRVRRAARKVRCRSMFSAYAHEQKVTKYWYCSTVFRDRGA